MNGVNSMFGNSISMMGKSLDYLWQKQGVFSNNFANIDTPGYKSKYLSFEETFRSKLSAASKTGNAAQIRRAIASAVPTLNESSEESARLDGNNVNADVQMVEMTRTALQYQYGINSVNSDITRLRTAIKGQ